MTEKLLVVGNLAKDIFGKEEYFGGSAANLAIAARKLGLEVGIISVLGKDIFSKKYKKYLETNDIDISLIQDSLEEISVCEVVSKVNSVSSSIWHDNNCHPAMEVMDFDNLKVQNYDLVHLVSCPTKLAKRISFSAVSLSFEPGPLLISDPNYFNPEVAKRSTFIFLNSEEKKVIKEKISKNILLSESYNKLQALVVTLGENGSNLYKKTAKNIIKIHIPAIKLTSEFINATGAGDNFKAGFLTAFLKEKPLEECLQIGNEMGAACVMQEGTILSTQTINKIKSKYNL